MKKKCCFIFEYKYWIFLLVFSALSLKSILFCWNYFFSKYHIHLRDDQNKSAFFLYKAAYYNPVQHLISKWHKKNLYDNLVEYSIRKKNLRFLENYSSRFLNFESIKQDFLDNFYWQYLSNNLDIKRNWENLDTVSFNLISDEKLNDVTMSILAKIGNHLSIRFLENICDFCIINGNRGLKNFIINNFDINTENLFLENTGGINYRHSRAKLLRFFKKKFGVSADELQVGISRSFDFSEIRHSEGDWIFPKINRNLEKKISSFGNQILLAGNRIVMLVAFAHRDMLKKFRFKISSRKTFKIDRGMNFFSFDYMTKTGEERIIAKLGYRIKKKFLISSNRKWIKVIFVFNGGKKKYNHFKPSIGLKGEGFLLIDNMIFGKFDSPKSVEIPGDVLFFERY